MRLFKDKLFFFLFIYYICILYSLTVNFVYHLTHPKKTQIEVLLRTHKNFIWNFKK
jgi:hypothetical protein